MGYTAIQYRSYTDDEWNALLLICNLYTKSITENTISIRELKIYHHIDRECYTSIHHNDEFFLLSLCIITAPSVFLKTERKLESIDILLSHVISLQHISCPDRIYLSFDNENIEIIDEKADLLFIITRLYFVSSINE